MTQDSQAIKEKIDKIEYLNIETKKKPSRWKTAAATTTTK